MYLNNYLNKNYDNDRILDVYVINIVCVYVYMYIWMVQHHLDSITQKTIRCPENFIDDKYGFI